jgi:hypothetical protein
VADVWVVNASPIIILARAGHLGLITDLANQVLVPAAVVSEVLAGPEADPARLALERGWGQRVVVEEVPVPVWNGVWERGRRRSSRSGARGRVPPLFWMTPKPGDVLAPSAFLSLAPWASSFGPRSAGE